MSTIWDSLFQPTPAQTLPSPLNDIYRNLALHPELIAEAAELVYPSLSPDPSSPNSLIALEGKPAGFDLPPSELSPDIFFEWHSGYQQNYINANKSAQDANGVLTIGNTATGQIHVTLSADQSEVFVLEALQVSDLAAMTKADQERIAKTDTFLNVLAPQFGLAASYDITSNTSLFKQTMDAIESFAASIDPTVFTAADKQVFIDELNIIKAKIESDGVHVPQQLNAAINEVKERFERVRAFAQSVATPEVAAPGFGQWENVVSLDGGATIRAGLKTFMDVERQVLTAKFSSFQLSSTGTLAGLTKKLDLPTLVAALEMNSRLEVEAISAGDTEMLRQINGYTETISRMQNLVSETVATFDIQKSEEERGLLGWHANDNLDNNRLTFVDPSSGITISHNTIERLFLGTDTSTGLIDGKIQAPPLTEEEQKVISMFENNLFDPTDPDAARHPVEVLFGIERQTFDFYSNEGSTLNYFQKHFWDQAASTLGGMVTQAGEQTQLIFNRVSEAQRRETNHLQNAMDTLAKAHDLYIRIAQFS